MHFHHVLRGRDAVSSEGVVTSRKSKRTNVTLSWMDQEEIKSERVQEKQESVINNKNDDDNTMNQPETKYDLRRRHNTDYRKFF